MLTSVLLALGMGAVFLFFGAKQLRRRKHIQGYLLALLGSWFVLLGLGVGTTGDAVSIAYARTVFLASAAIAYGWTLLFGDPHGRPTGEPVVDD